VCTKKQYVFQKVMDYQCAPEDEYQYCPYYRTEQEVVDYETEWDCHEVKVEDKTSFLCLNGCRDRTELQCQVKSKKPIQALRQFLNCKEDDPRGTAARVTGCTHPQYLCAKWAVNCSRYNVNEAFQVIHEEVAPKWRPFAIQKGEYPKHFEDQLYLKFVSPKGTVSECPLEKFGRFFRGNAIYIKIPDADNRDLPCGVPLWNSENQKPLYLPKVYLKDDIHYPETRLCGRTEYSFITKEVPASGTPTLVPAQFAKGTEAHMGPVPNSCRAENPVQIGPNLWFTEIPPVRIKGRVSVLGRVLESLVTQGGVQ
jgi:hypothetical protein